MNKWLREHGMPPITVVEKMDRNGNRLTLETECLRSGTLPSIAYGFKRCSQKHKVGPQEKFCNHHPLIEDWHWTRDDCIWAIQEAGLPLPGKSSCFFCPSMKREEIEALKRQHPDLYRRALAIEENAMPISKPSKVWGATTLGKSDMEWSD